MTHHNQPESTTLICPKCQGEMGTHQRNGVLIDQCPDCRGIFLDRGEIERLIEVGNSTADSESRPDTKRQIARQRRSDAHASRVIADMLVLMATEPKHVHPTAARPTNEPHTGS
jgi:Zn-finger nucleic acid-binding protein